MLRFNHVVRDNTYNSENSFSAEFTWSIWTCEDDTDDWCYNRETAYIAICRHRGGDVRGNYGPVTLHRVDLCIAESGFLDWVLGWRIERFETEIDIPIDELSEENADSICEEALVDERLSEEASPGYHSLPSNVLYENAGTDNCLWHDGKAIVKLEDGSGYLVATPYSYTDADITTPDDGCGWICDAMIDTDSFIRETIGDDIIGELLEWDNRKLSEWAESIEWDHDDEVGKLCGADCVLQYCDGGAS